MIDLLINAECQKMTGLYGPVKPKNALNKIQTKINFRASLSLSVRKVSWGKIYCYYNYAMIVTVPFTKAFFGIKDASSLPLHFSFFRKLHQRPRSCNGIGPKKVGFSKLGNTRIEYRITVMTQFHCTWCTSRKMQRHSRWRHDVIPSRMKLPTSWMTHRQPRDVIT